MTKQTSRYSILLLLAIMFAAPGIAAYIFYHHPTWLGASKTNKGFLLNPPLALHSLDNKSKWRIVLWSDKPCDDACLKELDLLARVRLALGRKLYQVDQWLLLDNRQHPLTDNAQNFLKEHDFHFSSVSPEDKTSLASFAENTRIFIVNPDNYLILTYQLTANPDDIYKDLKLLLNTTEKSG